jgi:hypothetical protein
MSLETIHAKVVRTRAEQGLPPTVSDPATLERVAAIFRLMAPEEPAPPKPRKHRCRKPPTSTRTDPEVAA